MKWRPMTEYVSPCPHKDLIVVAFYRDYPSHEDVFRIHVGEHGPVFRSDPTINLYDMGWVPFAWRVDDTPERNDPSFPPLPPLWMFC
jgi:hypothetical protein